MVILGNGPLPRFLQDAAEKPFQWGSWDCLMWLAEWVRERRGVDPGARHRHTYGTSQGAFLIVSRAGGMVAHVEACMRPLGIERTDVPKAGDIAVVSAPDNDMGALVLGPGSTICLSDAGMLIASTKVRPIIAAWGI